MGIRDQLTETLAGLRPIFYQNFLAFIGQENFSSDRYINRTALLFRVLHEFSQQVLQIEETEIEEDLPEKCQLLIDGLDTGDSRIFLAYAAAITEFLDVIINPEDTGLILTRELENPSPINRRVIDEQLRPQAGIVDRRKMEIIESGDPFDEAAFQDHNNQLVFSRRLYWQQLQTNMVQADLDDLFDCRDANHGIKNAHADNFLDKMDAARALLDSKIQPSFTENEPL